MSQKSNKKKAYFVHQMYTTQSNKPLYIIHGADEGNRTPVSALARLCSTIELHLQNKNGGPDGTRTHDLLRDREAC